MKQKLNKHPLGLLSLIILVLLIGTATLPALIGNMDKYERIRDNGERLQFYEARLAVSVVGLRHGLSNNYDEANEWVSNILQTEAELENNIITEQTVYPLLDDYEDISKTSLAQWERFKLTNALVRNSLRNFMSGSRDFIQSLNDTQGNIQIKQNLSRLSNVLVVEALGEDRNDERRSKDLISIAERQAASLDSEHKKELTRLLSHAEIITRYSADLEHKTELLVNGENQRRLAKILDLNQRRILAEQSAMTHYRIVLLLAVGILTVSTGILLSHYWDQRRRRDKEMRLAATVFNSSEQGILFTDVKGTIISVNEAFCTISGYDEAELLGKNPRILRSGVHDSAFYKALWDSITTTGRWRGEITNRCKNGNLCVLWSTIEAVKTSDGENLYVGIISDITEVTQARAQLTQLAYFDTLTQLPNRQLFLDRLDQSLARSRRENGQVVLIYADLDNFKAINDSLGHPAGDFLLTQVANRLRTSIRETDTVARVGGDEFALILGQTKGPREITRVAELVLKRISEPFNIHGQDVQGSVSLGIAVWPDDGATVEALMKNADVAMYRAKERGRNNYQFFTPEMGEAVAQALRVETGLRHALLANELSMHYQPQCTTKGNLIGVEALMRWKSADLGQVPPSYFIPIAERSGLIAQLGEFALDQACRQCSQWRADLAPNLRIAVNLSSTQFHNEGLVNMVAETLQKYNLPATALELEVTESVMVEDVARGRSILKSLKDLGCRISIDDFGTGYSSLAYLKRFNVDSLKIDKSFMENLGEHHDDDAIVRTIFGLSRSLRLEVVAEGVETLRQLETLRELSEDPEFLVQGYYFATPMSPADFEARFPYRFQ